MITNLENLLNEDQFNELVEAINANKDFKLAKDGWTIESKSTDNKVQININFDADNALADKEIKDFKILLENMDDEIFVTACEQLGSETLQEIQKALNSKDIKCARKAINMFKDVLRSIILNEIDHLKCLNSLLK